jgi:protein ImuB
MKRALCIWLPNWPLQRLAAAREELRSRAVVLYQRHAAGSARVVACAAPLASAAAGPWRRSSLAPAGIRPGMPLAEALALASPAEAPRPSAKPKSSRSSPSGRPLHLEIHDPHCDRVALEELARDCRRFSPVVGLEQAERADSLLLDVTGLDPLFGGELSLARQIVKALRQQGLAARVALADTLGAAWALAHYGPWTEAGEPLDTAAILAAMRQPILVPPGQRWHAPLSVAALRLPYETCSLLAELGVHRIEQLIALPRATLLARFGPLVLQRLDQADGTAAEAIVTCAAPDILEFACPFEHPTDRRETIEQALSQLIARACQALGQQRRGILRLQCRFEHERAAAQPLIVGLYRPSACPRHVEELARLKLESHRFRQPVSAVHLKVLVSDRLGFHQQELFDRQQSRAAPRELASLVDRLSNRLGAQAVVRPWLLSDAQPEFACHDQPLASLTRSHRGKKSATRPHKEPPPLGARPLSLEPSPVRLDVVSVVPEGPPLQFRRHNRNQRIVRAWGPERIETGWWRSRCVRRDYYQVETAEGQRLWLFRELTSGQWFLHGQFA